MSNYEHLLETIKPKNYDLAIELNTTKLEFNGEVIISAEALKSVDSFMLHQHQLDIKNIQINNIDSKPELDNDNDQVKILHPIEIGQKLEIKIIYSGKITEAMNGIYPSRNQEDLLIGTQFESHHAREAFPCIDEPAAKATFNLRLTAPKSGTFLSNTLPQSESTSNNKKTVVFNQTPKMSTYLLAFVWGNLKSLEAKTKNGTKIISWATPDKYEATAFALDVAVKSLEFYEEYFDEKYPLEHCHHIALPDFASGAMENWGCITYRESQMLVDENTSIGMKKAVAITVAHEVAHQWFGNLVTMQWWTDLWLNEGFASWISVYAIDQLFPEWKVWDDFVVDDVLIAIELDSLNNTHAIEIDIDKPEEIRGIFDAISYNKGASVIRMLNDYLGDESFKVGLRSYIRKHSYDNATTNDLWQVLEETADKPIQKMMSSWTKQAGFPLLKTKFSSNKIDVSQERFSFSSIDDKNIWHTPLYDGQNNNLETKTHQYQYDQQTLPIKLNQNQSGPYLVSYQKSQQKVINNLIEDGKLSSTDIAGYIYERFQLAQAGVEPSDQALDTVKTIKKINHLPIWQIASGKLSQTKKIMSSDEFDEQINKFIDELSSNQLEKLGYKETDTESEIQKELRSTILGLSVGSKNPESLKWARSEFNRVESFEQLNPNHRSIILSSVVRHGDKSDFEKVSSAYDSTSNAQLKISYTAALMNSKDPDLIKQNLADLKSERIKLQEVGYWIAFGLRNRYSREITWQWLKDNWQWIVDSFGRDIMSFAYFPIYAGKNVTTQDFLDDLKDFFENAHTVGIERQVAQAIEYAEIQVSWRKNDYDKLLDYLKHD